MKRILVILLAQTSQIALANESAHHVTGVPTVVYWQAVNLVILFSALVYFTKNKLVVLFAERRKSYIAAAEKSKKAKIEAEKQYLDIKHKLDILSSTKEESIARAKAEAADLRKSLIAEAQSMAVKIKAESKEAAQLEARKAFQNLKQQTIKESVAIAKQVLEKDIGNQDHQKLQNDFAKNLSGASL